MDQFRSRKLLQQVARRLRAVHAATRFCDALLASAGLYLLVLLVSRLLGVIPPWFSLPTLLFVPAAALIVAGIFHKRPTATAAAQAVDAQAGADDLFLTAATIDHTLGEYQPLVLAAAEQKAAAISGRRVVPFHWQRKTLTGSATLGVLCLGVLLLPQLDPFGRQRERQKVVEQQRRLAETIQATKLRTELLRNKSAGERTEQVNAAIQELMKTFNTAKPTDKAGNLRRLNEEQKQLGQLWRQLSEEKLKSTLPTAAAQQNFGLGDPAKIARWKSDLEKGDTGSVQKELKELKELAAQLAKTGDPVTREKLRQELMDRLQALKDTLAQPMNSAPLNAALQRAMEQLDLSDLQGLSPEALKALMESLELSELELEQFARAAGDLRQLEDALKALQLAKALNRQQELDGELCENYRTLGEYLALYLSQCGNLQYVIPGIGLGEGVGIGPRPHGDDTQTSAFDPEKSPSQLQPGKILMQLSNRGVSEPGQAREDFLQAVQSIRQQASEAILQENIPPGYQSTIKSYFDTLSENPPPAPSR